MDLNWTETRLVARNSDQSRDVLQILKQGLPTWCPRQQRGPQGPHRVPSVSSESEQLTSGLSLKFHFILLLFF